MALSPRRQKITINHDNLIFRHRGGKAGRDTIEVLGREEPLDGGGEDWGCAMGGIWAVRKQIVRVRDGDAYHM